jgi:hypothetical protein
MDEELQQPEPKISDVEAILIGTFLGILDIIDIIPIAGDITDIATTPLNFYFWSKGIQSTTFVVSQLLDLVPVVQEFPSRTIAWGITVYMDRHPKQFAALQTATAIAGVLEGQVGDAEGALAESEVAAQTTNAGFAAEEAGAAEGGAMGARSEMEVEAQAEENEHLNGEPGNKKPSEETTERNRGEGASSESWENAQQTPEEQTAAEDKAEKKKEYEEVIMSKAERDPIEIAEEEELGTEAFVPVASKKRMEAEQPVEKSTQDLLKEREIKMEKATEVEKEQKKVLQFPSPTKSSPPKSGKEGEDQDLALVA